MVEFWRFKSVDLADYNLLQGEFHYSLVLLSILVSSLAAYSCLIVIERMWSSNEAKTVSLWRLFGSIVFGLGVWAMHFTGMLAFMVPAQMSYHPGITALSFIPPVVGAYFAFQVLYSQRFSLLDILLSALYLALGIGSMHYLGMEAMQMDALMVYDVTWFALSILIAFLFACISIYMVKLRNRHYGENITHRALIAPIMGLSVAGMHYTAMGAVSFYALSDTPTVHNHMSDAHNIALIVALFVLLICAATFVASIVDQRLQRAEHSIVAGKLREQDILNNLADGVIIVDQEGIIDSINDMGLRMFEYKKEMLDHKNIEDLMPTFDKVSLQNGANNDLEHRSNLTTEGIKKDGRSFPIEVSLSALSIRNEDTKLFNCVIRDISTRMELEQQLRQAQKLESMGQLAAGIAHEINTPTQYVSDNTIFLKDAFQTCLNTITQITETIEKAEDQPVEKLKTQIKSEIVESDMDFIAEEIPLALDQSLEGLQRISKIVKAMKSFSHSSNHEMHQVDIAEAIESTITIARGEWRYVAEVETSFDSRLPAIPCYRDEFNQVMLNFIINAAHAIEEKFGRQDGTLGTIKVSTHFEENTAQIRIQDNGTGIPKNIIDRIFDPFFTTKDVGKGTGQGLSLAYSVIVDLHKGAITTDSTVGEGTTFTISLPLDNVSVGTEERLDNEAAAS
ncbi:MHYT domain-containing protein [Vibrio europaeus]|uniref:MHYT domain-containing protein n=1 Tax=Vibrio europaeus TaxID=300876 RepID=UPI00148E1B74|nr:MHYT domain-containing protein [Vibrio europaeus]MDC5819182.1 ATP-binding protein [Vibrio europaeus]MDC5838611.1 ATP-binding protein [Vibrio europaeus]MDC5856374.1 ATP-binding protein [Vibrio europaeus]MDC5870796.1 ATP-binding protein [Vibrio europaeus]NOH26318.1 PAS domain S-box protein [Vibrio europaeus]